MIYCCGSWDCNFFFNTDMLLDSLTLKRHLLTCWHFSFCNHCTFTSSLGCIFHCFSSVVARATSGTLVCTFLLLIGALLPTTAAVAFWGSCRLLSLMVYWVVVFFATFFSRDKFFIFQYNKHCTFFTYPCSEMYFDCAGVVSQTSV